MNISLFLGAGASQQFKMDTTSDFKNRLINDQNINPPVNRNQPQKQSTIASLLNNPELKDIEHVLDAVKKLRETMIPPNEFPEFAKIAWDKLTHVNFPNFKQIYEQLSSSFVAIHNQINQEVFKAYNWDEDNNNHLEFFYSRLFNLVNNNSKIINIGTTNYDQAIEKFCRLPNTKFRCYDGFEVNNGGLEANFAEENFDLKNIEKDKTNIRLFKIHGSLNWKKHGEKIQKNFGDKMAVKQNDRVFISPTLNPKEDVEIEPFTTLYSNFKKHLMESNICVVIGFSFRDEHINEIFEEFLKNPQHFIIVISPSCKSNFVRNYKKIESNSEELDEHWLKTNKQKNVELLEYAIKPDNDQVLIELGKKIDFIKPKIS